MEIQVKKKYYLSRSDFISVGIFYEGEKEVRFEEDVIGEALIEQENIAWYDPPNVVSDWKLGEYGHISCKEHPEIVEELDVFLLYDGDIVREITAEELPPGDNLFFQVMDFSLNEED